MDKKEELLGRVLEKEGTFIERKPNGAKRDELRKTLVAFANSMPEGQTAVMFVGVLDDGSTQGVSGVDSLQKTIRDICERDCYPAIKAVPVPLQIEGKDILAVEVPYSAKRPTRSDRTPS